MKNIRSLLITLHEPARIYLTKERLMRGRLILDDKIHSVPSFPRYPTCADLLVNSTDNEFVGLTYHVGDYGKEVVEFLITTLSPRVVRYVNSPLHEGALTYTSDGVEPNNFEIRWSSSEPDCVVGAQLSSDHWYYDEVLDEEWRLVALGLEHIDEILDDYELNFPTIKHLDLFEPKFFQD